MLWTMDVISCERFVNAFSVTAVIMINKYENTSLANFSDYYVCTQWILFACFRGAAKRTNCKMSFLQAKTDRIGTGHFHLNYYHIAYNRSANSKPISLCHIQKHNVFLRFAVISVQHRPQFNSTFLLFFCLAKQFDFALEKRNNNDKRRQQ